MLKAAALGVLGVFTLTTGILSYENYFCVEECGGVDLLSLKLSDSVTALLAALGVYGVIATLEAQHRPFLTPNFCQPKLRNGHEIRSLLDGDEAWFTFKNSGNSPAVITKMNRGWMSVQDSEISKLRPLSYIGKNWTNKHLVVGPGCETQKLKALIFSRPVRTQYLEHVPDLFGRGNIALFMVAIEYIDVLGNKYISHSTLRVSDGFVHQEQQNAKKLNFSRRKNVFDMLLEILI